MPSKPRQLRTAPKVEPTRRETSTKRGYDYRWQQFRERYLASHPICADCQRPATEVHHVTKLSAAPWLKYKDRNLMALCKRCHSARTSKGE